MSHDIFDIFEFNFLIVNYNLNMGGARVRLFVKCSSLRDVLSIFDEFSALVLE